MNFLFIIPGFFNLEKYQKLLYYNDLPLGTLQISSYLKKNHPIKTDIIDMRVEEENDPKWDSKLKDILKFKKHLINILESNKIQDYQYIGINCFTSYQYLQSKLIAELIKQNFKDKIIFVGGYHPSSANPQDFCYKNSPFDFIIKNEAELILSEYFRNHNKYRTNENTVPQILKSKKLIDLNDLPPPDYDLYINKYPYKDKFKFELYTSRGCPYQCSFCSLNYRFRTVSFEIFKKYFDKIVEIVLEQNKKYPKISFADQAFFSMPLREKILDYIIHNELYENITFSCQSRIETVAKNPKLINKIRKTNLIVGYGLESADKMLLTEMKKTRDPTKYLEMMKKIIQFYKQEDINYCRLNLLCGFPGENEETFNNTINFIEEFATHENIQLSPSLFACYPNTPAYLKMNYYENQFGSKFNRNWWIENVNHFKLSVLKKCSYNYSLKDLLYDYKRQYLGLLKHFKYQRFKILVIWGRFFSQWYHELLS